MNITMIRRLVLKDWHFYRVTIGFYLVAGVVGLGLLAAGGEAAVYAGAILLLTTLLALGVHLAIDTVVHERTQQTLPFVMSLPISVMDYTTAKILANLLIFMVPWAGLVVGTFAVIGGGEVLPAGSLPFFALVLMYLVFFLCLLLATALITESEGATIVAIVAGNLLLQAFMYGVSHLPSVAADLDGDVARWTPVVLGILLAETATVVGLLGLTFVCQGRKKDFL